MPQHVTMTSCRIISILVVTVMYYLLINYNMHIYGHSCMLLTSNRWYTYVCHNTFTILLTNEWKWNRKQKREPDMISSKILLIFNQIYKNLSVLHFVCHWRRRISECRTTTKMEKIRKYSFCAWNYKLQCSCW